MTTRSLLAVMLLIVALPWNAANAGDPAAGIPPDGNAGPVQTVKQLKSTTTLNSMVTTELLQVTSVSCPNCASATSAADFWAKSSTGSIRVHVQNTWQATYNVKKEVNVPKVGQFVVAQGRLQQAGSERYIELKRFGERDHAGPTVKAYDVAAGKYPTGTYVWLAPVKVLNVGRWDDGDYSFDLRDPAGGGLVHSELSPPFNGQLRIPNKGETVQPYGYVRFDPDHNWWELHPIRCWNPGECAPISAGYVRNGPPPGTPSSGGYYLQGKAEPVWVPLTSGGGGGTTTTFSATFTVHSPGEYWQQVTIAPSSGHTVASARVRVNGGAWSPMQHQSYGDWTSSVHTVAGSKVEFQATDSAGAIATSPAFTWMSGSSTGTSAGGSSGSGTLAAVFQPTGGNDWWVQVAVSAPKPLARVEVSANDGPWVTLDHASWGDWVKSMYAHGSVRFRATATDGSSKTSPAITWPTSPDPPHIDPPPLRATFVPGGGEDSAIRVAIDPNRDVATVKVQVDYGPWVSMTRGSDGSFASQLAPTGHWEYWGSKVVPEPGSLVVFWAETADGESAYSYPFSWAPDGD